MALTFNQTPTVCNIRFLAGDDVKMPFAIYEEIPTPTGPMESPMDLTGYTMETYIVAGETVIQGTVVPVSPTSGAIVATYSDTDTKKIPDGLWHWHLKITDTGDYTRTIIHGSVEVGCNVGCE